MFLAPIKSYKGSCIEVANITHSRYPPWPDGTADTGPVVFKTKYHLCILIRMGHSIAHNSRIFTRFLDYYKFCFCITH